MLDRAIKSIELKVKEVKDPFPKEKLTGVVYQIPCQCSKLYVGRGLETWVKEHRDACNKGDTWKSAIAEYQWDQQHQVNWDKTRVPGQSYQVPIQLKVKEASHIQGPPLTTDSTVTGAMSYWAAG